MRPFLKTPQVEMLILERMCQFMHHHRLLSLEFQPIGKIEFTGFAVVVAGHLLGQKLDNKGPILKVARRQAKLP